jgi:hypothetical protein
MTTNLRSSSLQYTARSILMTLALVAGTALFLGCSDDVTVAPDAPVNSVAPATTSPASVSGLIVQSFPSQENPGPPLYASGLSLGLTGFGATRTDGEWVAITFVREPTCVPDDYNLLSGPDIPGAFACPLTIEGRVWLRDLSSSNPVKAQHRGLGEVPVYFVQLSEFETAVMDAELTIVELNGLPSLLIGDASFHRDVIQFPQNGRPGMHSIVSRGELQDGRSFRHSGVVVGTENVQTKIEHK